MALTLSTGLRQGELLALTWEDCAQTVGSSWVANAPSRRSPTRPGEDSTCGSDDRPVRADDGAAANPSDHSAEDSSTAGGNLVRERLRLSFWNRHGVEPSQFLPWVPVQPRTLGTPESRIPSPLCSTRCATLPPPTGSGWGSRYTWLVAGSGTRPQPSP